MNKNIFDYICCPKCKSDLMEQDNFLVCEKCDKKYKIQDGIPILVDLENLPKHLREQIRYFEKEDTSRPEYKLAEWQKSYVRRLDENFRLKTEEILIDVGTGSGYMAVEMAKRGLKVIACDLTLKELVKLKNVILKGSLENNLFLVCCSAEELPLKNNIADYFISNAVLEHLPREKDAIREVNRVCHNRARLMITVPLTYKFLNPLLIPVNLIHDKRIGHLRRYEEKTLSDKFNGWKLIKTYYTGHFSKVIKVLLNTLAKLFDDKEIERQDRKKNNKKFGATNIICFLEK
ncbi:MAG: methyltransferase domain-containing protein [Parcubacteria group bacterium]|nr:methyltransferase domain-containing protein [Parcubacteria group bacterium]